MESGIEACDLRQPWIGAADGFDHGDFPRQMLRVIGLETLQLRHEFRRDPLWLGMLHAVHHSVTHGAHRGEQRMRAQPLHEERGHGVVVCRSQRGGGLDVARLMPLTAPQFAHRHACIAGTDAVDFPIQQFRRRIVRVINRDTHAGRSTIEGQDIAHTRSMPQCHDRQARLRRGKRRASA